jgi:hypothetical protein
VVLYGSRARPAEGILSADNGSDVDIHVIARKCTQAGSDEWSRSLSEMGFCFRVERASAGGVRKVTLHFSAGEADLVLLPEYLMRATRVAVRIGMHNHFRPLNRSLNNMATMLKDGYRFLKGEKSWGPFYSHVASEFPGCRLDRNEVLKMASFFLSDLLLVIRLIERGELIAAQRTIHKSLSEINILLQHELRLRNGDVARLQGRLAELILKPEELKLIRVDARLQAEDLSAAAQRLYVGMLQQMSQLVPEWKVPPMYDQLLKSCLKRRH